MTTKNGWEYESKCEGSGNCYDCDIWDCYYNDTINPDTEGLDWNAEMDIMEMIDNNMWKPEDMTVLEINNMLVDICHFEDQYRPELKKDEIKKISEAVSIINAFVVNNLNNKKSD